VIDVPARISPSVVRSADPPRLGCAGFASKRNKAKLHLFCMCFACFAKKMNTISLVSLCFALFYFDFFATIRSEGKDTVICVVLLHHLFRFALFPVNSFASMRSKVKHTFILHSFTSLHVHTFTYTYILYIYTYVHGDDRSCT